jgi:hypothetical protein
MPTTQHAVRGASLEIVLEEHPELVMTVPGIKHPGELDPEKPDDQES